MKKAEPMDSWIKRLLRSREFACAAIYSHPELSHPAFDAGGIVKTDLDPAVAGVCKNESNCTVFLTDGAWFTTWSQGSFEHAKDERIVFAISRDHGRTWTTPRPIVYSTAAERNAYGAPFVVPATGRIYLFFFAGNQSVPGNSPEYDAGNIYFVYSDDSGATWSDRIRIDLPDRDLNVFAGRFNGWINHPPQLMPTGDVVLPMSHANRIGLHRHNWMLNPAEVSILRCDNILNETDPGKLRFTLLPTGPRGIRVNVERHIANAALRRLVETFNGAIEQSAFNFCEMTVVPLSNGHWMGVGRTFLGSPGYTISADRGQTWTEVEPLRYAPDGEIIRHPMTMCPIAKTTDGRFVLMFTNNDGTQRGARHVWDGNGRTRNPQWFVVGRELPSEARNGGLVFGKPRILAEVDDTGETNLKTGISMPQFFESDGRFFAAYNINKEHILLDEIPASILEDMTP